MSKHCWRNRLLLPLGPWNPFGVSRAEHLGFDFMKKEKPNNFLPKSCFFFFFVFSMKCVFLRGLDSGFHLIGSHQHGRGYDQASSSSCLPSSGFGASSASTWLWRGHRNGSELSLFGLFEPGSAHPLCTCRGCSSTAPCLLISAVSSSISGMLRLRRSWRRTDLSWPKNTVNILGSVLCSLMVQAANTPKPTSYTQSLAPKEILCLHHMKSWIRIQS